MLTNNATEKILPALRSERPEAILQALDTIRLLGQNNLRTWHELRKLCRHTNDAVAYRAATALAALYHKGTSPAMPAIVRLAPIFAGSAGKMNNGRGDQTFSDESIDMVFARSRGALFQTTFHSVHAQAQTAGKADARTLREYWRPLLLEMRTESTQLLIWLLGQNDDSAEFALDLLSEIGTPAAAAVPAVTALQSGDASYLLRLRACLALARLDPDRADETALSIIDFLRSPDHRVRLLAADALHGIQHNLERVIPALAAAHLQTNERDLREATRDCLISLGPTGLPVLMRCLAMYFPDTQNSNDEQPETNGIEYQDPELLTTQTNALDLAGAVAVAHGAPAVQMILADCPHTNLQERRLSTAITRQVLKEHPHKIAELTEWCGDSPTRIVELLQSLTNLKGLPENVERHNVRPFIVRYLETKETETRVVAIQALSLRLDEESTTHCIRFLEDADFRIRESAATTLGSGGPAARKAIQPLLDCLKDDAIEVRGAAAAALAKVSPDAGAMFPDLMAAFHLRENAETAGARASFHFLQHLSDKLASSDPRIVERTLEKIAELGHRGLGILPALKVCLRNEDLWVRARTLKILMTYGDMARDLLTDVRALKTDDDWYVRQLVMQCLPALGAGPSATDDLIHTMNHDAQEDVRKEAVRSLGLLGEDAAEAAPELVRVLADASRSELHTLAEQSLDRMKQNAANTKIPEQLSR